jgi:uncharacterized membrane protein
MEYASLILLHVAFGIVWAGGAIVLGLFIVPSVLDAGPGGGAVMANVVRRRMPMVLTLSAGLVVLTGVRLFMLRFSADWVGTPEGIVLSIGALLGLGAFVIGVFVQKPTAEKIGALAAEMARSGQPPSAEQAATLRALQQRLRKTAALTAWHLVGSSLLMASHRLAAML